MPFERRNLRDSVKKRERQEFLTKFPEKAQKRFEHIAEKMKEISSPFAVATIPNAKKSSEKLKKTQKNKKTDSSNINLKKIKKLDILEDFDTENSQNPAPEKNRFSSSLPFLEYPKKTTRTFFTALILLLIFWGTAGLQIKNFLENFSKHDFVSKAVEVASKTLGTELQTDSQNRTNILLLGAGGSRHEGAYLTDSIIVVSLNHNTKSISMFSIPRDLYVSYTINRNKRKGKINALFRDGYNYWKFRSSNSSEIFANSSVIIKEKVEEIIGGDIQYTAFIDFDGFVDIVDELGGVTLDVEKNIYDTSYPGPNYSYQTFSLNAGLQTLDGATSLKYVRSRHGNAGGDFGRSYRQKKMIMAIKEKAFAEGVFTNPEKLQNFFTILKNHFWTDLSSSEILSAVNFVKDISKDQIISVGITDDVEQGVGGFLYTPPRDDIEHRMSVFLPYLSAEAHPYAQINYYWENVSSYPSLNNGSKKIEIYNTTKRSGLAGKTAQNLLRYNIQNALVDDIDEEQETTRIEYISTPENEKIAQFLKRKLNIKFEGLSKEEAQKRYPKISGETVVNTSPENKSEEEDNQEITPLSPLTLNTFRIIIGKDFNSNAYKGSLIRTPLKEKIEQ